MNDNDSLFFFFFQAEDGIRDRNVTGVQTCALPIFAGTERERRGAVRTRDSSAQARVEPRLRAAAKPRPGCSSHRAHGGGDSRMARAERADGADGERSRSSRGAALMGVSPRV